MTRAPHSPSGRPAPGEYAPYAEADIARVEGSDAMAVLEALARHTLGLLNSLPEDRLGGLRYAPGKWTLKDVVGHVVDDERVFAHRAFSIARGERLPLPGFDEEVYAAHGAADLRPWEELLSDYRAVRAASLALFRGLSPSGWIRVGEVNGYRATPRGLAFHIAGHEQHHVGLLRERYLPLLA
jgi:hypothetical protein